MQDQRHRVQRKQFRVLFPIIQIVLETIQNIEIHNIAFALKYSDSLLHTNVCWDLHVLKVPGDEALLDSVVSGYW